MWQDWRPRALRQRAAQRLIAGAVILKRKLRVHACDLPRTGDLDGLALSDLQALPRYFGAIVAVPSKLVNVDEPSAATLMSMIVPRIPIVAVGVSTR